MKKELWGVINLGWSTQVLLPLEEAHRLQTILAEHAIGVGTKYIDGATPIYYMTDYEAPTVLVRDKGLPPWDCRGLTRDEIVDWESGLGTATDAIMDPQVYTAIRRDAT